jgi:hypothetical protein
MLRESNHAATVKSRQPVANVSRAGARRSVAALPPAKAARHVSRTLSLTADELPALHQRRCVQHEE